MSGRVGAGQYGVEAFAIVTGKAADRRGGVPEGVDADRGL